MKATVLHVLAALAHWTVSSPEHALIAGVIGLVLFLALRSRAAPEQARGSSLVSVLVAAGALLTGWWFLAHPGKPPAAASKPSTRTVIIHQTVTKVVQVAGHTGLPPWAIVIVAVVALGALCGLRYARSSS